ncbi:MAG: hypothetical protein MI802_19220, partial [Desulfobacterales bacterium]|nr:hypothetical protein [Desulfobacterales bacterium]
AFVFPELLEFFGVGECFSDAGHGVVSLLLRLSFYKSGAVQVQVKTGFRMNTSANSCVFLQNQPFSGKGIFTVRVWL